MKKIILVCLGLLIIGGLILYFYKASEDDVKVISEDYERAYF